MSDQCGSTDTTSGEPCQFSPGESCPHHDESENLPDKFTTQRTKRLIEAARMGALKKDIANYGGITHKTLNNWLREGEERGEGELFEFYQDFTRARGEGAMNKLKEAGAEFVLERSYGYTKSQEIEHSGEGGVLMVPGMATEEEWEEQIAD